MASLAQDDVKSKEAENDSNDSNGVNEIGNSIIDNEAGVMWSIGFNGQGQHGNGTENKVEQLTLHQWAKDLEIVKVVSGMNCLVLFIGSGINYGEIGSYPWFCYQ